MFAQMFVCGLLYTTKCTKTYEVHDANFHTIFFLLFWVSRSCV